MTATKKKPATLTELCPSNYLESAEFEVEQTLTIKDWALEEVGPESEECGVMYFEEVKKGLVLNKTKKKALLERYGNELENMVGEKVTLFATEVMAFGSMKPAIGMRIPKN